MYLENRKTKTTDQDLEDALQGIFDALTLPPADKEDLVEATGMDVPDLDQVSTFAEKGVLTNNKGIVIRLQDGREFQITIVQSR